MPSERVQRQIDRLLDEVEQAVAASDWTQVRTKAEQVLAFDPENADAPAFLAAAERMLLRAADGGVVAPAPPAGDTAPSQLAPTVAATPAPTVALPADAPTTFAGGRYQVRRFLGEGGAKRVFLAYDTQLDREVAFALIKTERLDAAGLDRIRREAQAMGRLGDHPHVVTVYDLGEEQGQPYIVSQYMAGGDVAELLTRSDEHRLPLDRVLGIGADLCRALAFAHAHEVIHRDIKPENVWLTADGTAKLGDFGVAVALERTRLTQEPMIIGTAAYLSPEQAVGGDVTPRSDLYSLGALLYELLTGRPPFVGDDFLTVISQHLHTAPVAPSWHRPDCPPALENLILRLLAKSAADRPADATAVLSDLTAIDPSAPAAPHQQGNPLQRLARGVFVGRERELARLRAAFDDAVSGRGGVVLLVGEPGIGKTRTAQELETYARVRGAQVLWGRAHEAAGAPAYWPWVQALRAYVATVEPEVLRSQLGSGAAEVGRVVSEVRERLPSLPEAAAITDPDQAQFRLFDAITTFLANAAAATPLVVVLDDLHWADKPTLLLLQHVAREIGRSRLLLVGTYRDVEVGRAHPLAATLAELGREHLFERVNLTGLSREEVERYIGGTANVDPSRELLAAIYEETEGNPFFVSEVVALLVQEGSLLRPGTGVGARAAIAVPQSVREVLGRRLDRLSADCNELLTLAAVAGRDFTYDLLAALSPQSAARSPDDERLLALVEEAIEGRVIQESGTPGEYRFSHALVQETLLGEISTTRRVRLHGQVAEALERLYGRDAARHAPELARHFLESATLTRGHAGKALRYSKEAAEQAEAATAWAEAARHYETCLSLVTAADDGLGEDEATLLTALGRCYRNGGEWRASWRSLMRAITLYRERDDAVGMGHATLEALAIVGAPPARRASLVEDALAALGDADPYLEARLLVELAAGSLWSETDDWAAVRAAELARTHGYDDVKARLTIRDGVRATDQGRLAEAQTIWHAGHEALVRAGRPLEAAAVLSFSATTFCWEGALDDALAALAEATAFSDRIHARFQEQNNRGAIAGIALARCEYERFETLLDEIAGDYFVCDLQRATRAELAGDMEQAVALLPAPERASGIAAFLTLTHGCRARVRMNAGDEDGARHELSAWIQALADVPPRNFLPYAWIDETLPALADEPVVRTSYERLAARPWVRFLSWPAHSIDRIRCALALRLGLLDKAETWYRAGRNWAERERCPVERGRCLQGVAEVAARRGQHAEARRLLDQAAALFQRHGALLYLRQVQEQSARLR